MLFEMEMGEFEDHYKRCLLPVADGTFDGVYSQHFKELTTSLLCEHFTKYSGQNIIFILKI